MGNGMYRIAEAYVGNKAPALRVASDRNARIVDDGVLLASVGNDKSQAGFFRA